LEKHNIPGSEYIGQSWSQWQEAWLNKSRILTWATQDTTFNDNFNWNTSLQRWEPATRRYITGTGYRYKDILQIRDAATQSWRDNERHINYLWPDMVGDTTVNERWNEVSNAWDTTLLYIGFLNADGNRDSTHREILFGTSTIFETDCRYYYSIHQVEPPVQDLSEFQCVFANPYDPATNIRCQLPPGAHSEYRAELFDMSGRRVAGHVMPETGLFSFADYSLPAGVYVLRILHVDKRIMVRKLCVLPRSGF
jgi:hypothetical protein